MMNYDYGGADDVFDDDGGNDGVGDIGKFSSESRNVELAFSPGGSEGAMQVMKKVETAFR